MTDNAGRHQNGTGRYIVKHATRAQIKAAQMLLAREEQGLSSPSDKARALADAEPSEPGTEPS
jgi:hypothetical protein